MLSHFCYKINLNVSSQNLKKRKWEEKRGREGERMRKGGNKYPYVHGIVPSNHTKPVKNYLEI